MNNKEKISEVYQIVEYLSRNTVILRVKSLRLSVWQVITALLPMVVYFSLLFLLPNDLFEKTETNQTIALIAGFVVFLFCFYVEIRLYYRLGMRFNEVKKACGELSDMIDWTTMRKKQVYNSLDPKIQQTIDGFYEYSMSTMCPFYGGKKKYKGLRLLSIVELVVVMFISILITFGFVNVV